MIPILFASTETNFTHNGIGRLVDCISCSVTEERNGIYEVELKYPVTGKWFDEMMQGGIIGVIHDDNHDIQPFDIYKSDAPIDGVVTFYAHHISYRLNNIILEPYTASSASAAVSGLSTHSVNTNPFTFTTDKTTLADFKLERPSSVRAVLWGQEGSLLDTFGTAEFKFDKFSVQMLAARGSDTGVTVRYGKNMTEMERTVDDSGTYNAIAPYWTDGTNYVYPSEIIVQPTTAITPVKPVAMDMSDKFETMPKASQVRAAAKSYLDANEPWHKEDTITINFIALWQTPEYENVASIQKVGLCDTVSIYYTDMNIIAEKAKIVRIVFDVLAERFSEIEVGKGSNSYVAIDNGSSAQQTYNNSGTNIIQAQGSGDDTSITAGTITQIPLTTEVFNSGVFAVESGGIIVPVSGWYRLSASVYMRAAANSTTIACYAREGTTFATATEIASGSMVTYNTANQYPTASISPIMVQLTAGNSVYLACRVNGAAGIYYPTNKATFLQLEAINTSGQYSGGGSDINISQDAGTGILSIS